MTDRPLVGRRMSRRTALAAAVCVTGLLTGGAPAAVALEFDGGVDADGYCVTSGGERKRYVVEAEGHVESRANEEFRVQVTVRMKERFGRRWTNRPTRTVTSKVQYAPSDEVRWPLYSRRWTRRQGRQIKEVKGTATLKLLNASGAVVDTGGPFRFRSPYDGRVGMTPCKRGGSPVTSWGRR